MSKGDWRRPESKDKSFDRGWAKIDWSDGSKPVRYELVSEEEWRVPCGSDCPNKDGK